MVAQPYVALIFAIFSVDVDLTNSLFMKRPIGCLYLRPFGVVRSRKRSEDMPMLMAILRGDTNNLRGL